jgi:hypothetical protein
MQAKSSRGRKNPTGRAAGGTPFPATQTNAVEFPGGASLRFLKGAGLDVSPLQPSHRTLTSLGNSRGRPILPDFVHPKDGGPPDPTRPFRAQVIPFFPIGGRRTEKY